MENNKAGATNTGVNISLSEEPTNNSSNNNTARLTEFLGVFFPNEQEPINLRFLDCKSLDGRELSKHLQQNARNFSTSRLELKQNGFVNQIRLLQDANKKQGIYFIVNAGGNSNKDIIRFNAFFVESDTLPIDEQNERLNNSPLPPSIRIQTNKSIHAYWLINGNCTAQEWGEMQKRLIAYFDSDKAIINPARPMRLPFFNHVRYDESSAKYIYKRVELKESDTSRRYTIEEMRAAFPAVRNERAAALSGDVQTAQIANSAFMSDIENSPQEAQNQAEKCLPYLSRERCDNYYDWLNVGIALHNIFSGTEKGLELWRDWSRQSEKYKDGVCEEKWQTFFGHLIGSKLTVGSLIHWAQTDSEEFRRLWQDQIQITDVPKREKQSTVLLNSVMNSLELFHTAEGECFAVIRNNGYQETHKINNKAFKDWLSYEFYRQEGKTPNAQAITDVIQTLTGKARFDSPQIEVFLRVAEKDNAIYVDLCDEKWRVVEITKSGWRVLEHSPVKFRRTKGMLALPNPLPGGNLINLKNFINVCDGDFILVLAWLVACFCFNKPYPVLILHGEQGSAKSTTSRVLRRLIDPNKADLREKPKENRDLMIAANNGYVVAYDNLSSLSAELSDSLCRLATGGGFSTRELYSNDEETIFDVVRPLILNGIEETASRSDLLDRALLIECPRITEQRRKTEAECKDAFAYEHSKLLGALFDAVSTALRNLPNTRLQELPRMADFARWACAAEPAFNLPAFSFLERYQSNRATVHEVTLEGSPIGKALLRFMQTRNEWQGTTEELRGLLTSSFDTGLTGFPKTAKGLGGALKRLAPTLRANGIEITKEIPTANKRIITIIKKM